VRAVAKPAKTTKSLRQTLRFPLTLKPALNPTRDLPISLMVLKRMLKDAQKKKKQRMKFKTTQVTQPYSWVRDLVVFGTGSGLWKKSTKHQLCAFSILGLEKLVASSFCFVF
jgi:hypothetical protein